MSSTTIAPQEGAAVTNIQVDGNVAGDIIVGNNNLKVNTNYGTLIYHAAHEPAIKRRDVKPQPPRAPLNFFDRAGELAQLEEFIKQGKAVTICGLDGAGKSALLRQAANGNAAHTLPDGVVLIEGQDEKGYALQPGDVIQRLFEEFYLSDPPVQAVHTASAHPYLSSLRPLLLLDHLTLGTDQFRLLLDQLPASPVLIARLYSLPGHTCPIQLGPLPHGDAMSLFAAAGGLPLDDTTRPALDEICALLNDVPLAIVLAADVIRQMNLTLEQACQRLSAAPPATDDVISVGLSRAQALIQSVLTPLEQQVLGIVANLPGLSIEPQKIVSISGANALNIQMAVEHLKALGMLHANSPRVSLDPGLRDLLRRTGNEDLIKDRLLAQLMKDWRSGRFGDDAYCAAELGQVLGVLEWAVQRNRWNEVMALGHGIDRYLTLHGLWDAWGQVADRVLQAARASNNRSAEAWALHQLGTRAASIDQPQAIDLLKQALHLRLSNGELTAAAYTQHNLDLLIPPPPPPPQSSGPSPVAPAGMSTALKAIIAIAAIGVIGAIGMVGYQVLRPAGLQLPQVIVVEAAGPEGAAVTFDAAAIDPGGGNVAVTCQPSSGSTFKIGQTTVTCSTSNRYGLATSGSFQVKVQHIAAPQITLPQPMNLEAVSPAGAVAEYSVSAIDVVDGPVAVTCDPSSGSTFAVGTTTVTCTAADTQGNVDRESFSVEVRHTTLPGVKVPGDMTLEATSTLGAVGTYSVPATDLVDRATVTCDHPSGSTFPLGKTKIMCTATDEHKNAGQGSFQINVQHTIPPTLTLPTEIIAEATSPKGAVVTYTVSAQDAVDRATVACAPPSGATFPLSITTVACTATDTYSNVGRGNFQINVQHTISPTLTLPPDKIAEATSPKGAVVTYTVSVKDAVDRATWACDHKPGSTFPLGKTKVACTATDTHKNVSRGSFQVTVQHTIRPTMVLPPDMTVEATSSKGADVGGYPVLVTDAVDRATWSCDHQPGSTFPLGLTKVSCTASDEHNNVSQGSFQINVQHTIPPTPILPPDMTVEATSPAGAEVNYPPVSVNDSVDSATVTCDHPSPATFPLGTTTVTCTATDEHDNKDTGKFNVTVQDTTPPSVSDLNESSSICQQGQWFSARASDALGISSVTLNYTLYYRNGAEPTSVLVMYIDETGEYSVWVPIPDDVIDYFGYNITATDNSGLDAATPEKTLEIVCCGVC